MGIKLEKNKTILIFSLITALTCYSNTAIANESINDSEKKQVNTEISSIQTENPKIIHVAKAQTTIKVANSNPENSVKINYKIFNNKDKKSDYAVIYINNKEVVKYNYTVGGYSPEARAKILVHRLQQFISQNGNPKNIIPGKENSCNVGRAGKIILFTADDKNAESLGLSTSGLSIHWVNKIREALGAPKIVRGNSFIASRGNISTAFATKYLGKQETGVASWYGGKFHGRKAADGSVFNKHEYTAAHKSYPFGTLVKVTNLNNNKICIVKITDRGPFVRGRIIDLSRAAAKEIGVLSAGVSKVKIEVIGKI